jgi:hypothetical protein
VLSVLLLICSVLIQGVASSSAASPAAASTPDTRPDIKSEQPSSTDLKPKEIKVEKNGDYATGNGSEEKPSIHAESPPRSMSTIDSFRATPRTAKSDKIAGTIRAIDSQGDAVRDRCAEMMYDALAIDSTAGESEELHRGLTVEAGDGPADTG